MTFLNAFLLTGALAGGAAPAPIPNGSAWVLTGMSGSKTMLTGNAPTLTVKAATIGGNSGCNSYNASAKFSGTRLEVSRIATTRRACEPSVMALENSYLKLLGSATTYRLSTDKKTLTISAGQTGTLTFRAKGGQSVTPTQTRAASSLSGDWRISELRLGQKAVKVPVTAQLHMKANGDTLQVSGQVDCNQLNAQATISGAALTFGGPGMTRMMCGTMEGEQALSQLLRQPVQVTENRADMEMTWNNALGSVKLSRWVVHQRAAVPATVTPKPLDKRNFTLVSIGGEQTKTERPVSLSFDGGRVGGDDGCNSFGAPYTIGKGGELLLTGPITSTAAACANNFPRLTGLLSKQPRLSLNGEKLMLTVGEANWVFEER